MSAPVPIKVNMPSLAMSEQDLINVLQTSIYPGAKPESIKLVISYCKAANLDPMQKPVHIVPMDVPTGKKDSDGWDIKEKRDVVMPGIGLYRIQAARTGEYAGITEPEFGEEAVLEGVTYPKWCRVTVKRFAAGRTVEFTAKELWIENYATKNRKSKEPNAMWAKRPFAQLAKCAEAQALRKAFPEIGSQPTAEEMEGKVIDVDDVAPATRPAIEQPHARTEVDMPPESAASQKKPTEPDTRLMNDGQRRIIRAKLKNANLTDVDLHAKFGKKLGSDEEPTQFLFSQFHAVTEWIAENAK